MVLVRALRIIAIAGAAVALAGPAAAVNPPALTEAYGVDHEVRLLWAEVAGAGAYNIYRATAPTRPALPAFAMQGCNLARFPGLGERCSFTNPGRTNGTVYHYWVTTVVAGVESAPRGPSTATPSPPPPPPPGLGVERNRIVAGPSAVVAPGDGVVLSIHPGLTGDAAVPYGGVSATFRHPDGRPGPVPTFHARIEGSGYSDLQIAPVAGRTRGNRRAASQYRFSFFSLSPMNVCSTWLYAYNRSDLPIDVTVNVIDYGKDPLPQGTITVPPRRHKLWQLESLVAAPEQKSECIAGTVSLEHDGASPRDIIAFLRSSDELDLGSQYEQTLGLVGEAVTGTIHTTALRVDDDNVTNVTVRNNAATALEVTSVAYVDGAPAESIAPTLYAFWEPATTPGVTGYRLYRRPLCIDESCEPWERINAVPTAHPAQADNRDVLYDTEYEYSVAASRNYFNEGHVHLPPVPAHLPSRLTGRHVRHLPHFAYGRWSDTEIRLRNTIDHAVGATVTYLRRDGSELAQCELIVPPNRSAVASAKLCVEPHAGPELEGAVRVEHTAERGALLIDGRFQPGRGAATDIPSFAPWPASHPGDSACPYFYVGQQARVESTIHLINLDDVETEVVPTYHALDLFWRNDVACTGEPIILPPEGSAAVSALVNAGGCLDGSFIGSVRLVSTFTQRPVPTDAESHVAAFLTITDRGEAPFFPDERIVTTLYESTEPAGLIAPANAIATAPASPVDVTPAAAAVVFYAIDDGAGLPRRIDLTKSPGGVQISF